MAIKIVKGNAGDIDAFADLLLEVQSGMQNKDWFYVDPKEYLQQLMDSGMMHLWLAKDGGRIAGAFDLLIPGSDPVNYGYALGYSRDQLQKVVNMDSAAVHPDYRGMGLQLKLLQAAEEWLQGQGDRILLCTIHPENRYSLQNALKLGYRVQKELEYYGSVRYILRKDIAE